MECFQQLYYFVFSFKVADSLDLDPIPSAYQIRFQGCKGMLAIDPSLPNGDVREILLYRKSMNKFVSSHSALEICEATKPSELIGQIQRQRLSRAKPETFNKWLASIVYEMYKICFLFFLEYFSFRNSTFAFKNYS